MIDFGPVDELREVRRRLSEECGNDIGRYAAMLQEVATRMPGRYITQQLPAREMSSVPSGADNAPTTPVFPPVQESRA